MNAVDLGVNLFVTLFALLDPIGNLPIFAAATAGATRCAGCAGLGRRSLVLGQERPGGGRKN